jgi:hypothetical protein
MSVKKALQPPAIEELFRKTRMEHLHLCSGPIVLKLFTKVLKLVISLNNMIQPRCFGMNVKKALQPPAPKVLFRKPEWDIAFVELAYLF